VARVAASIRFSRSSGSSKELRKRAGTWLKQRRQAVGLSQIELAQKLGFKYYTFISQVENGFGRVPSQSMEDWAAVLGIPPDEFARRLLSYYDPDLHRILFGRAQTVSRRES
jgi:transcriptional regulator with XRE-family HTH domain